MIRRLLLAALLCVAATAALANGLGLGLDVPDVAAKSTSGGGPFVGPFDSLPATTAAYSLRRLYSAYTANKAVNVRCPSGTNGDVGFTASGDFNTTTFNTLANGGSCYVAKWYDQSGNGNDAAQATAPNQPQLKLSQQDGHPAIVFTQSSSQYLSTSASPTIVTALSAYSLSRFTNPGAGNSLAQLGSPLATTTGISLLTWIRTSFGDYDTGDLVAFGAGYSAGAAPRAIATTPAGYSDGLYHCNVVSLSASVAQTYIDNVAVTMRVSDVGAVPSETTHLYIGSDSGSDYFGGAIGELALWTPSALSSGQLSTLHTAASAYWGTP